MTRIGRVPPRIRVSLRVFGEHLDPTVLTKGLGVNPSQSYHRGDVISARRPDALRPNGMWLLDSALSPEAALDEQIVRILARLPDPVAVWHQLTAQYNRDLFCGVFVSEQVSGISISANTVAQIAIRGLELHVDFTVENDEVDD